MVRKAELEVDFLWCCWIKIGRKQSWEFSNICSVNVNHPELKSVGSRELPQTNTWSKLLWIARLLDQDREGSSFC